jgi:hypothetical protein
MSNKKVLGSGGAGWFADFHTHVQNLSYYRIKTEVSPKYLSNRKDKPIS